jgi:CspA family cold shock protein
VIAAPSFVGAQSAWPAGRNIRIVVPFPPAGATDVLGRIMAERFGEYWGARVVVEAVPRQKGLQAIRVISVDNSTALHPAEMPPPRTHVQVSATSGYERVMVKWFNRLRGFGFVTRGEGQPDIFVHMEVLRRYGIQDLVPGQFVFVRFGDGPKGQMAAEVRLDGTSSGPMVS